MEQVGRCCCPLGHTSCGSAEQSGFYQHSRGVCAWPPHIAVCGQGAPGSHLSHHPCPLGDCPHSYTPSSQKTAASVDLPVMNISYKWNHMMWLLYIVSFVLQDVFKVYPYCNMYQYFTPFLWLNDIPMNGRTTLGYPSVDGHLSCSHFLGIMNNTAMNIHGTVLCAHVFISLRCVPRSGIAGGCLCLSFSWGGGTSKFVSKC